MWTCTGRPLISCRNLLGAGNGLTLVGYWFLTDAFIYRKPIYKRWQNRDVRVTETCQNVPMWSVENSPLLCVSSCRVLSPALCERSVITTVHHCGLAPPVARPRRRQGRLLLQTTHKTECRAWDIMSSSLPFLSHMRALSQQRRDTRHTTTDISQDNTLYLSRSNMKKADAWHKHSCACKALQP